MKTGSMRARRARANVNGIALKAGDAMKLAEETRIVMMQGRDAEVQVFDLS